METDILPAHIAIIMDGNGRWAKQRRLPRVAGHKAGLDVVRNIVRECIGRGIKVLTLFTFSSENWKRPPEEVTYLMGLFHSALTREMDKLHEQNVRLSIIGDRSRFDRKFCERIEAAELLTARNTGLHLVIAFNYGGRWDLAQAVARLLKDSHLQNLTATEDDLPALIQERLSLAGMPDPDLLIRTSGEKRISNFFLWQLAYTELYFADTFWPDFDTGEFEQALAFYAGRERRFGGTG